MGTTPEGIVEYQQIKKIHGKGFSYETDLLFDDWDKLYSDGIKSYEVYVLTNPTKPIRLNFGPYLEFNHQPYYVGYGQINHRNEESMGVGRNQDKYDFKSRILMEIRKQGSLPRSIIIGYFYTQQKAMLVERKVMNTIHRSFIYNVEHHRCDIPLNKYDCNVIFNKNIPSLQLTI